MDSDWDSDSDSGSNSDLNSDSNTDSNSDSNTDSNSDSSSGSSGLGRGSNEAELHASDIPCGQITTQGSCCTTTSTDGECDFTRSPIDVMAQECHSSISSHCVQCHLLRPSTHQTDPLVPIIYLADADNAVPLLVSSLFQRKVLGLTTPVVGILYSAKTDASYIILGRVDEDDSTDKACPHFYASIPREGATCPADGVFNMRSPTDVFALARFLTLVSTRASSASWLQRSEDKEAHNESTEFIWRADRTLEDAHIANVDVAKRLEMWRAQVHPGSGFGDTYDVDNVETSCGGGSQADLLWPSTPNSWLLDSRLSTKVDIKQVAGIGEWLLDHHVFTIGFVPCGPSHKHYRAFTDGFFYMLHPCISDKPLLKCQCHNLKPMYNITSDVLPTPPKYDAFAVLRHPIIEALTPIICAMCAGHREQDSLTLPLELRQVWEVLLAWFWRVWVPKEVPVGSFKYLSHAHLHYSRCVEYDKIKCTTATESSQRSTNLNNQASSDATESPPGASQSYYLPYQDFYSTVDSNICLTRLDPFAFRDASYQIVEDGNSLHEQYHELLQASRHTSSVEGGLRRLIQGVKIHDYSSVLSFRDSCLRQLTRRILRYPVAGVHAVVAVNLVGVTKAIRAVLGNTVIPNLQATFPIIQSQDAPGLPASDHDDLRVPIMIITYQTEGEILQHATRNRQRLACTSAVQFLAMLGVMDFPIYGLSVCGPHGIPCFAWYSSTERCCIIMDRNTAGHGFDLSNEIGILRYIAFLSKVAERGQELHKRLQEAMPAFLDRIQTDDGRKSMRWTAQSQLDEYKLSLEEFLDVEHPRDVMEAIRELVNTGNTSEESTIASDS
ncbi:hypothetical protein C8Q78DRAFT_1064430 [Trametes maxima]|nr:hypothetical protein C8Q78DRAFT_1064430 [Trametes maxima]